MAGSLKLGTLKKSAEHLQAADQVKEWTRARFSLPDEAAILVTELNCTIPGCPPLETVVAFWNDQGDRHHFKIFKAVADVSSADMPPAWLKDSLFAFDGDELQCC